MSISAVDSRGTDVGGPDDSYTRNRNRSHRPNNNSNSGSGSDGSANSNSNPNSTSGPAVGEYTQSLMQLVEAQILARLETAAGRKILLEEAAYYNNDLAAAKAAIVRCARNKVKRKLHGTCDDRMNTQSQPQLQSQSQPQPQQGRSATNRGE